MTDWEIVQALHVRLLAMANPPEIVWPNEKDTGRTPRLEVAPLANEPQTLSLSGNHRRRFLYQVTVVTENGRPAELEKQARELAEAVVALFPWNLEIEPGLRVYRRPYTTQGFVDKAEYRLPVTIMAEFIDGNGVIVLPSITTLGGQVVTLGGQPLAIGG